MLTSLLTALLLQTTPAVGEIAPDFTAVDSEGKSHTLSAMVERGPVILAFFPKAFTPGCTRQLTAFHSKFADLEAAKAQVLAISTDDAATMKRFKEDLKASFAFIPDPEGKLVKLYDSKMPVVTRASRNTFVIGKGRKILEVQSGSDAIDPGPAVAACSIKKPASTP